MRRASSPRPRRGRSESVRCGARKRRLMRASLDLVLPYVHERRQFGQPIGSFQLMQGKIADMYTALQSSRAFAYAVAQAYDAGQRSRVDAATQSATRSRRRRNHAAAD